jgi:hypothetical protein
LGESNDSYFHARDYARIVEDGQARKTRPGRPVSTHWFEITLKLRPFTVPQYLPLYPDYPIMHSRSVWLP